MSVLEKIRAEIEECLEAIENIKSFQLQILSANEIEARKLTYEQCLGFIDKYAEQDFCEKCEVGNPCLYCKHEFEPQESEDKE